MSRERSGGPAATQVSESAPASASAPPAPASALPPNVAAHLQALRALYVAESATEGEARLARERPVNRESFESAVARRLLELRSLSHLADYLHRAGSPTRPAVPDDD